VLHDDQHFFPLYEAVLVYRLDLEEKAPRAVAAFKQLEGRITESEVIAMNGSAQDRVPMQEIAADFLTRNFGSVSAVEVESDAHRLWRLTLEHLTLVGVSLGAAILVGLPLDASVSESRNVTTLNRNYESLAQSSAGVTYDDAGQAVLADGKYTRTLPCLPFEPCTGPAGTNIVRAPDGIHFCPTGHTTLIGSLEQCDVYSSGAFRFASAMLGPALRGPPSP